MEHRFETHVVWDGSTAGGYRAYSRNHRAVAPPSAQELSLSSARAFHGDASQINPEQLLVMAASSCQLLSFLALATRVGLDVRGYSDDALGTMPHSAGPMSVAQIVLRPHIVLAPGTDPSVVAALVEQAHAECFIANSLRTSITVEPTVTVLSR
ncbi:MAG: OsmC family protein [Pseudonocardiales bacterium]|nr:OsmC family protein [Pseudonocardiales bacterium]